MCNTSFYEKSNYSIIWVIESYLQGKFQFNVIKSQLPNINNKKCLRACLKGNEAVKGNEEVLRDKNGALKSDKMH